MNVYKQIIFVIAVVFLKFGGLSEPGKWIVAGFSSVAMVAVGRHRDDDDTMGGHRQVPSNDEAMAAYLRQRGRFTFRKQTSGDDR